MTTTFSKHFSYALVFAVSLHLCLTSVDAQQMKSAKIVSMRPSLLVLDTQQRTSAAKVGLRVGIGTALRTDDFGRASLLLPNHMLLKLAEKTEFLYRGIDQGGAAGQLRRGKVWLRGQRRASPFKIQTPTATAAIRGTEWYMEVAADGTTKVGVLEGVVSVSNSLGQVELASNELALVEPGKAPVKLAYLTPDNAVNWTLNYFGLWDAKDYAKGNPRVSAAIRAMLTAYYDSNLEKAYSSLNKVPESDRASSASWQAAAGFLSLVSGKDEQAKQYFDNARRLDSFWALPEAHLALMELIANNTDKALTLSENAIKVEKTSAVAYIVRAYALKGALRLEDAYEAAKKAVALSPTFDAALLTAARIALELEQFNELRDLLSRVDRNSPLRYQSETLSGFLALRKRDNHRALEHFKTALSRNADSVDALIGQGIALFKTDDQDAAIESFIRATAVAPQISSYQSYLAKAYFELDRDADGMKAIERAKRLDPKDPTPHLYEALYKQSLFQPGQALSSLLEAAKLNENRAVFRSRYLLDQDQSILTSNMAQIYNELGFDQSSTQEAARALELDPTNPAAHRRQFFALRFDPRNYAQAASSERLLNNLFTPPTRTAVVLDEDTLSPYASTFSKPGVDGIFSLRAFNNSQKVNETQSVEAKALAAVELEQPVAFSVDVAANYATRETESRGINANGDNQLRNEKTDTLQFTYRSFVKAKPSENVEFFIDSTLIDSDADTESVSNILSMSSRAAMLAVSSEAMDGMPPRPEDAPEGMPPASGEAPSGMPPASGEAPGGMPPASGEMPSDMPPASMDTSDVMPSPPGEGEAPEDRPMEMPDNGGSRTSDTDTKFDLIDLDTGIHLKPAPGWHVLAHGSLHLDKRTNKTDRPLMDTTLGTETVTNSQDFDYYIGQTAVWKRVGNHFLQIGGRYYHEDRDEDDSEVRAAGMRPPVSDAELQTYFLLDQYNGFKNVTLTAALNIDHLNYDYDAGASSSKTNVGPSFGASYKADRNMYFRAAFINNLAGDRSERLQQTLIAGFPFQRLTLIEPFTNEQLFNLEYETYSLGWDYYSESLRSFFGAEVEYDRQKTESLEDITVSEPTAVSNTTKRARLFVETLLNTQTAATFTYRFDTFEFPLDTQRHGFDTTFAYFFDWGMAAKLRAAVVHFAEGNDSNGDATIYSVTPSLEGYPLQKRLRLELAAPMDTDDNRGVRLNLVWYQ